MYLEILRVLTCTSGVHDLWHSSFPKAHCRMLPKRTTVIKLIQSAVTKQVQIVLHSFKMRTEMSTFAAATAVSTSSTLAKETLVIALSK